MLHPKSKQLTENSIEKKSIKPDTWLPRPLGKTKEDTGFCLTMHQPWASLVIYGIKRLEGRSWNPDFQGPLWIHAAAKEVSPELITAVEEPYRGIRKGLEFPKFYPTSVLLGRVYVTESISNQVLQQRQAEEQQGEGETPQKGLEVPTYSEGSDSEFVFVCVSPQKLLVPMQMSGQHKIWKLPRNVFIPAQQQLKKITYA